MLRFMSEFCAWCVGEVSTREADPLLVILPETLFKIQPEHVAQLVYMCMQLFQVKVGWSR